MDNDCLLRPIKIGDRVMFTVNPHQYYGTEGVVVDIKTHYNVPYHFIIWENNQWLTTGGWSKQQIKKITDT